MTPILKWQYEKIEGHLGLLEEHLVDPSCPCKTAGEACPRKHLKRIEDYSLETAIIEERNGGDSKMLYELAEEAKDWREQEEKGLCGKKVKELTNVAWAAGWRKRLEMMLVNSCEVPQKHETAPKLAPGKVRDWAKLRDWEVRELAEKGYPEAIAEIARREATTPDSHVKHHREKHTATIEMHRSSPIVRISGHCTADKTCSVKVKASESVERTSSLKGIAKAVDAVLRDMEEASVAVGSTKTFAIGPATLTRYEFEYKVVEATILIPSHNPFTFEPNPAYPQELQPRLRGRAANRLQVEQIAQNLDPDVLLTDFHSIDKGAPIVFDSIVESGNGRVMAIQHAIENVPQSYQRYKESLISRAPEFGLDAEGVSSMKYPVLVRQRLTDVAQRTFVEEANASTVLAPSAIETARTDAAKITSEMLDALSVAPHQAIEDALRSPVNKEFMGRFLQKLSKNEQAALVDSGGTINQEGVRRVSMALFLSAFPSDIGLALAQSFFESTDVNVKNVLNGLMGALGPLSKVEALTSSGARAEELAIGADLAASIAVLSNIKKTPGMDVATYLAQIPLFEKALTPFQETVLKNLDARSRSGKKVTDLLRAYASVVLNSPPPAQGELMPGSRLTKEQAWAEAIQNAEAQVSLFREKVWCPGTKKADEAVRKALSTIKSLQRTLESGKHNLETGLNICAGQSSFLNQHHSTELPREDAHDLSAIAELLNLHGVGPLPAWNGELCHGKAVEHGYALCKTTGGELTRGPIACGTRDKVHILAACPPKSAMIGSYHTHPGEEEGIPSAKDIQSARKHDLEYLCVGGDRTLNCYKMGEA